jgi:hypothetical protein
VNARPHEETRVHTRLLTTALLVEDARAYWSHARLGARASAQEAFDGYWFGARSLERVEVLLTTLRARFAAFPDGLDVLRRWPHMGPDARAVLCHWHLQLTDPLYRAFTGDALPARRASGRTEITRDVVVRWVTERGPAQWTLPTRIQFASKLLSACRSAGLVSRTRDPRPLTLPRVHDDALTYLLYLLRETEFAGTLLDNPYLRSVGLQGAALDDRLRALRALDFRRQGDLIEFGWAFDSLRAWADDTLGPAATSSEPEPS